MEYYMTQSYSIVRRPALAFLTLATFASLLAVAIVPASASVVAEPGKPNTFIKTLDQAGTPGDHITFTRLFVTKKGSLKSNSSIKASITVSFTQSSGGLIADAAVRVTVVNLSTGATVVNHTGTLTFANQSKTFIWNISGSTPTGYRITVTNLGKKTKQLSMEVK
jgi:hypothetical protein